MEKKKRNLLKKTASFGLMGVALPVSWSKPMVSSILLPAHAMMSSCSETQIVGKWSYITRQEIPFKVSLLSNGTGNVEGSGTPLTWTFNGINQVIVKIPIGPLSGKKEVYDGVINAPNCDFIQGIRYLQNVSMESFVANKDTP